MGGVFGGGSTPAVRAAVAAVAPPPAPAPEPVQATSQETKLAANTRARRRMGTRLLFNADRSAGLGQDQTTLGGGAGQGQSTLSS